MRRFAVWMLFVAGVIGLLFVFSFRWWDGPNGPEFRMGYPDSIVIWESLPNGAFRAEANFLRWSGLILFISLYALFQAQALRHATRLDRRQSEDAEPGAAPDPGRIVGPGSS